MFLVGAIFLGGSTFLVIKSFEARNLIVAAMWGCLGLAIGIFLCVTAITGFPE
jgi:hypothetical protein